MVSFEVTCFGTGSHGNITRNQSCTGLTVTTSSYKESWAFDCGDAATRQIISVESPFHAKNITRIFITHLHLDHVGGLASLLSFLSTGYYKHHGSFTFHIYGPRHLSALLLPSLYYSQTYIDFPVVIHELLNVGESLDDLGSVEMYNIKTMPIYPAEDGYWDCFQDHYVSVRSGRLTHGVPCFGYSIKERGPYGKKVAIFGDTCDSSHMISLVENCDLLLHELSVGPALSDIDESYLSHQQSEWRNDIADVLRDPVKGRKWKSVSDRAMLTDHSNAEMTGTFAKKVHAKKLCCIHIGGRYSRYDPLKKEAINQMLKSRVEEYYDGEVVIGTDGLTIRVYVCLL